MMRKLPFKMGEPLGNMGMNPSNKKMCAKHSTPMSKYAVRVSRDP
jgi:hypothetical protein